MKKIFFLFVFVCVGCIVGCAGGIKMPPPYIDEMRMYSVEDLHHLKLEIENKKLWRKLDPPLEVVYEGKRYGAEKFVVDPVCSYYYLILKLEGKEKPVYIGRFSLEEQEKIQKRIEKEIQKK